MTAPEHSGGASGDELPPRRSSVSSAASSATSAARSSPSLLFALPGRSPCSPCSRCSSTSSADAEPCPDRSHRRLPHVGDGLVERGERRSVAGHQGHADDRRHRRRVALPARRRVRGLPRGVRASIAARSVRADQHPQPRGRAVDRVRHPRPRHLREVPATTSPVGHGASPAASRSPCSCCRSSSSPRPRRCAPCPSYIREGAFGVGATRWEVVAQPRAPRGRARHPHRDRAGARPGARRGRPDPSRGRGDRASHHRREEPRGSSSGAASPRCPSSSSPTRARLAKTSGL